MATVSGSLVVCLGLDGKPQHWLRYFATTKSWRTACHSPLTAYENEHRAVRKVRTVRLSCKDCQGRLADALMDNEERFEIWRRLFNEPL
jgi:hypothetical protein